MMSSLISFTRVSRFACRLGLAVVAFGSLPFAATRAITIDWVTVGDAGNAADTDPSGYGAVSEAFQIMKYEFTNQQYVDFLNSVATVSDPYNYYAPVGQGGDPRCGVTRSGAAGSYVYSVKANMGDKPVNVVSSFDTARVCNWLHNGATGTSSTETGAYTLNGQTTGTFPQPNPGARYTLPTENQWYKAAYYKGGGTSAGYWNYATRSDTIPGKVTSGTTGVGSRPAGTGDFANFASTADWNSLDGNVTTVGTNGGPSAYGAFDMTGNVWEWTSTAANTAVLWTRGAAWDTADNGTLMSSANRSNQATTTQVNTLGFRLVSVPEPSTYALTAMCTLAMGGLMARRRQTRVGGPRPTQTVNADRLKTGATEEHRLKTCAT
jgi:formylglycine-generating enzyme required for sulfatase activity